MRYRLHLSSFNSLGEYKQTYVLEVPEINVRVDECYHCTQVPTYSTMVVHSIEIISQKLFTTCSNIPHLSSRLFNKRMILLLVRNISTKFKQTGRGLG